MLLCMERLDPTKRVKALLSADPPATVRELRVQGFTALQLKEAGVSIPEMIKGGYGGEALVLEAKDERCMLRTRRGTEVYQQTQDRSGLHFIIKFCIHLSFWMTLLHMHACDCSSGGLRQLGRCSVGPNTVCNVDNILQVDGVTYVELGSGSGAYVRLNETIVSAGLGALGSDLEAGLSALGSGLQRLGAVSPDLERYLLNRRLRS